MKPRNCERAVLDALGCTPMTVTELARKTGFARRTVQSTLRRLRDTARVYVYRIDPPDDFVRDTPVHVYKLGKGKEAVYRAASNATRCARYKAKRRRNTTAPFPLADAWRNVASA